MLVVVMDVRPKAARQAGSDLPQKVEVNMRSEVKRSYARSFGRVAKRWPGAGEWKGAIGCRRVSWCSELEEIISSA